MKSFNSVNRNRPLQVSLFKPESKEESVILDVAKLTGETSVAFLKSVVDRGYYDEIYDALQEYRWEVRQGRQIRNKAKFLNHLIRKRLPGRTYQNLPRKRR